MIAINVESQAVIDEAVDRLIGGGGQIVAQAAVALRQELESMQNWAEGLEVTIGPITIPAFKITLGRNK